MKIYAIGDSHSIFFHNSKVIKEHWVSFANLPVTWYRLINEKLDLYNIGNILGNGHEKYNIKEGDYVLFYYGYNDIQKNIYKYAKINYKNEIDNLVNKYINLLLELKKVYKIIPIVSCIYPNPLKKSNDIYGSDNERNKYILYTNNKLERKCKENNIIFFNIYDLISDKNGYIKKEYTKDGIHLDYDNIYLRNTIDNKILELITV